MDNNLDTMNFELYNETRAKIPVVPFLEIKNVILGKKYELSLVFPNKKNATQLHLDWKGKDGPVNILSFPLDTYEGEIFISLDAAKTECVKFDRDYGNYVAFLFIHGCTHLRGYTHGTAMEKYEKTIRKKFGI